MKKLSVFIYINAILCLLYSFFSLSFNADISLLAFPLCLIYTAFVIYFSIFNLLKKNTIKRISLVRELITYEPFLFITTFIIQRAGALPMSYAKDLVCAILWTLILVISCILKYYFLSEKHFPKFNEKWAKERESNPLRKPHGLKRVFFEIAETLDAVVWAVFVIALVNIFIVQLYRIPSESMVPTFLVGDRAIVWKTSAGPKFPLSEVGIPRMQDYKKGDIVVFRNPHYKDDRKSEVKNYLSNFLYMISFTLINVNTDENGELKADPLVKRIAGLPGEQLIMMDGSLYYRTKDNLEFKKSESDEKFAAWNLNKLSSESQRKIEWMPLSQSEYNSTLQIEEERRSLNIKDEYEECLALSQKFSSLAKGQNVNEEDVENLIPPERRSPYSLFATVDSLAATLYTIDGGAQWFSHFMTDWASSATAKGLSLEELKEDGSITGQNLYGGDLYTDSLFRLNIMVKKTFASMVLNTIENMLLDVEDPYYSVKEAELSQERDALQNYAVELYNYISRMDQRNMPLFPANDESGAPVFLAEDSYFMMGDNRYNSLDMRHSYTKKLVSLNADDPYSVTYNTNIQPQAVNVNKIQGKANFCIWPLSRAGSIKGKVRN